MATNIYKTTLKDLKDFYKDDIIMSYLLDNYGFDAFNIGKEFEGSLIDGDGTLYLLITDYNPITIDGEPVEFVEDILVDYPIKTLEDNGFVRPITDDIIKRNLSKYEVADINVDRVLTDLVESEGYTFIEVLEAAIDFDLLEQYI